MSKAAITSHCQKQGTGCAEALVCTRASLMEGFIVRESLNHVLTATLLYFIQNHFILSRCLILSLILSSTKSLSNSVWMMPWSCSFLFLSYIAAVSEIIQRSILGILKQHCIVLHHLKANEEVYFSIIIKVVSIGCQGKQPVWEDNFLLKFVFVVDVFELHCLLPFACFAS